MLHKKKLKYVAKLYGISVRWAQIIAKEYRETGQVSPPKRRGRRKYRYEGKNRLVGLSRGG